MKASFCFSALIGCLLLLASCASISHVTDDDVYVVKSPTLANSDELNDESSYENYRYRRERSDYDVNYGQYYQYNPYFGYTPYIGLGYTYGSLYNGYGYGYNPYGYSPYGYNPYAYNPYGYDPFGYNPFGYGYGLYGPYGYNPYGFYGNPYGGYYGNNFWNNSNWNNQPAHANMVYAPRSSVSGMHNPRRTIVPGMKGMAKQPGSGTRTRPNNTAAGNRPGSSAGTNGKPVSASSNTPTTGRNPGNTTGTSRSRPVEEGQALSRPGTKVSGTTESSGRRPTNVESGNTQSRRSPAPAGNENRTRISTPTPSNSGGGGSGGRGGGISTPTPQPASGGGRRGGG